MRHELPDDVTSLVKPASVHRSLYDDPAIFELELERIFGSAWIYVGHESQVREPGD
jgi:phenylpropionate dioxygenase-like ring-hydroxylating dioxygenase large terminal subunit